MNDNVDNLNGASNVFLTDYELTSTSSTALMMLWFLLLFFITIIIIIISFFGIHCDVLKSRCHWKI